MKKNDFHENDQNLVSSPAKKNKFKFLTFFAGLLNLALSVLTIFVILYFIQAIYPTLADPNSAAILVGIFVLPVLFLLCAVCVVAAILYMILGIMMIVVSFKEDKSFIRIRGLVITTIVVDFLLTVCLFFGAFTNGSTVYWFMIIGAITLFSGILKIVDLKLTSKRISKNKEHKDIDLNTIENTNNVSNGQTQVDFSGLKTKSKNEEKNKLDELKNSGIITEEEYNEMSKKLDK